MKRALVMLIVGTVGCGVAAAFACMGTPSEAAQAIDTEGARVASSDLK